MRLHPSIGKFHREGRVHLAIERCNRMFHNVVAIQLVALVGSDDLYKRAVLVGSKSCEGLTCLSAEISRLSS